MDITKEFKDKLELSIVEGIAFGLENKTLAESDLPQISQFVLDKIDTINTQEELRTFLAELSEKWSALKQVELIAMRDLNQQHEMRTVEQVTDLANSGQIEEAIDLAKLTTQK